MALKRDLDSLVYSDTEEPCTAPSNKRQRKQTNKGKHSQRQPAVDPTYGQKCAFPVLDDLAIPSDDDLEFEDQTEALAYLRSVQEETSRIPHVVVAPKAGPQLPPEFDLASSDDFYDGVDRSIYRSGVGDYRGYYCDGAYTAAPDPSSSDEEKGELYEDEDEDRDGVARKQPALSEAYFTSLMSRFTKLRERLHQDPPQSALDDLPPDHETEVGAFGPNTPTFRMWTHRLRYTDPLPAQIAAMDKVSILKLFRILLGGKFFRRGSTLRLRTSQWIWALLARLPDRGQLDADEIGAIRALGKRAVLVSISREHVAALCQVLGREEVKALGLCGVLDEIEERAGEPGLGLADDAEEVALAEEDGWPADEDDPLEARKTLVDIDNKHQVASTSRTNGTERATTADIDHEDGQLLEEVEATSETRPMATNADPEDGGEMDMDIEEGEVADEPLANKDKEPDIEALKARLLANLDEVPTWEEHPATPPAVEDAAEDPEADLANMRATVNMILTVAGEFYGQRDLLAFRDPFAGVPFETSSDYE